MQQSMSKYFALSCFVAQMSQVSPGVHTGHYSFFKIFFNTSQLCCLLFYQYFLCFCLYLCQQMANEAKPCPCDIGDRMEYGALGQEVQIEHFKAYVVKPSTASDKAIIVIQDIFGWQLPNTRYMADMLAANGYMCVYVTDSLIDWIEIHVGFLESVIF